MSKLTLLRMTDLQDADRLLYSAKNMFNNDAFKILFRAIFSLKIFLFAPSVVQSRPGNKEELFPFTLGFSPLFFVPFLFYYRLNKIISQWANWVCVCMLVWGGNLKERMRVHFWSALKSSTHKLVKGLIICTFWILIELRCIYVQMRTTSTRCKLILLSCF